MWLHPHGWGTQQSFFNMLTERAGDVEITLDILESVQSPEILEILLQHQYCCQDTPDVFETLASNPVCDGSLVQAMLEKEPRVLPTSNVVLLVRTSDYFETDIPAILRSLFDRNPSISVSEAMITSCQHPDHLEVLLSKPQRPDPTEVLERIQMSWAGIMEVIWQVKTR